MARRLRRIVFWSCITLGVLLGIAFSYGMGLIAMTVAIAFCGGHAAMLGYGLSNIGTGPFSNRGRASRQEDAQDEDEHWHEDRQRAMHRGWLDDDGPHDDLHHLHQDDGDQRW